MTPCWTGVRTEFNMNDKYYYQVDYGTNQDTTLASNLLGIDTDDEMANRMVNFWRSPPTRWWAS